MMISNKFSTGLMRAGCQIHPRLICQKQVVKLIRDWLCQRQAGKDVTMNEKILSARKNGMLFLVLLIGLYALAVVLFVQGIRLGSGNEPKLSLFLPGFIWMCAGWFPFFGLKVLKPN